VGRAGFLQFQSDFFLESTIKKKYWSFRGKHVRYQLIREQTELVKESLSKRQMETDIIDEIVALDENDGR